MYPVTSVFADGRDQIGPPEHTAGVPANRPRDSFLPGQWENLQESTLFDAKKNMVRTMVSSLRFTLSLNQKGKNPEMNPNPTYEINNLH